MTGKPMACVLEVQSSTNWDCNRCFLIPILTCPAKTSKFWPSSSINELISSSQGPPSLCCLWNRFLLPWGRSSHPTAPALTVTFCVPFLLGRGSAVISVLTTHGPWVFCQSPAAEGGNHVSDLLTTVLGVGQNSRAGRKSSTSASAFPTVTPHHHFPSLIKE